MGGFIFAGFYLIFSLVEWLGHLFSLLRHLHNLPGDERRVIHTFMQWDSRTKGLISGAAAATALSRMSILEPCSEINPNHYAAKRGDTFFTMRPWIFRYLKKRPHLYAVDLLTAKNEGGK